jgi:hypothetical protein
MAQCCDHSKAGIGPQSVAKLASETAALREEVTRLRTQPRVFQASRCAASGAPLELPVVHFLCGHSFNLRMLGDNDRECPLCAPDQRRVAEIRQSMLVSCGGARRFVRLSSDERHVHRAAMCRKDDSGSLIRLQAASLQPERFFAELHEAPDGFAVVAEHFGRGLMNAASLPSAAVIGSGVGSFMS